MSKENGPLAGLEKGALEFFAHLPGPETIKDAEKAVFQANVLSIAISLRRIADGLAKRKGDGDE